MFLLQNKVMPGSWNPRNAPPPLKLDLAAKREKQREKR